MFTGIVQAVGTVLEAGSHASSRHLRALRGDAMTVPTAPRRLVVSGCLPHPVAPGDSVAVNGCCLTHVGSQSAIELSFDLSDETLGRTNLGRLKPGDSVNLEGALRAGEPISGHFVQGHVDAVGEVLGRTDGASGVEFRFRAPEEGNRYLADKGSIAVDGVSLTVVEPRGAEFSAWVVPFTLQSTNLGGLVAGDLVNLEYDLIARYLGRLFASTDD